MEEERDPSLEVEGLGSSSGNEARLRKTLRMIEKDVSEDPQCARWQPGPQAAQAPASFCESSFNQRSGIPIFTALYCVSQSGCHLR